MIRVLLERRIKRKYIPNGNGQIPEHVHVLRKEECPSNSSFLKNNGAEAHCF